VTNLQVESTLLGTGFISWGLFDGEKKSKSSTSQVGRLKTIKNPPWTNDVNAV
jgi:hypothetical protein